MPNVVRVVFREGGKVYKFDAGSIELAIGDLVVVDSVRGNDFGRVVGVASGLSGDRVPRNIKRVIRAATEADHETIARHCKLEQEARQECCRLIVELKLQMKVVSARMSFDGGDTTILFFAEERVDFRELVSRLSERLKRRVELKQVSAREEARLAGGFGPCGRQLCCSLFASDQEPVSIRMAKDQSLPLNPAKISGCCGRLMCCLKYEHGVYTSFKKRAPKKGATVHTAEGDGRVIELLATTDSVVVDFGDGRVTTLKLAELAPAKEADQS